MMSLLDCLNESERKGRLLWLILGIVVPLINFAFVFGYFIYTVVVQHPSAHFWHGAFVVYALLVLWLGYYLPYYCGYKKHGTAYLMFSIIVTALYIALYLFFLMELAVTYFNVQSLPLSILYIFLTWNLIQTNKKILVSKYRESEGYRRAMEAFCSLAPEVTCEEQKARLIQSSDTVEEWNEILQAYKDYLNT